MRPFRTEKELENKVTNFLTGAVVALAFSVTPTQAVYADPIRTAAETAAQWAIDTGNANALAESIESLIARGGRLAKDDAFSVDAYVQELLKLDGGALLVANLDRLAARGQIGGSPRTDIRLDAGETHRVSFLVMTGEAAFVEVRLHKDSGAADIDIKLYNSQGELVGEDTGPTTGSVDTGALLEHWPASCDRLELEVENIGPDPAQVAVLIPQSLHMSCGG